MTQNATPHLSLPYILPAQAQKHLTHNDALRRLDSLIDLYVLEDNMSAAPSSPAEGDIYILGENPAGFGGGDTNQIALFEDGMWQILLPKSGQQAFIAALSKLKIFDGSAWTEVSGSAEGSAETAALFGINTSADTTNRLAVKSDAILLSHDDVTPGSGDMRIVVNKASTSDTASFIFQNNYSGRAEFGLSGEDNFSVKVSPDGAQFIQALSIDMASGAVRFPASPLGQVKRVQFSSGSGSYVPPAGVKALRVLAIGGGGGGAGARTQSGADFVGAGGGGAGGICEHLISGNDIAPSYSFAVGAGGTGGSADETAAVGARSGGNGGDTTFSGTGLNINARGGSGAAEDTASPNLNPFFGGNGGTATGAQINLSGQKGDGGITKASEFYQIGTGKGASTPYGQGGGYQNGNGLPGKGYGAGGSGCGMLPGYVLNRSGGDGAPGLLIIDEYY